LVLVVLVAQPVMLLALTVLTACFRQLHQRAVGAAGIQTATVVLVVRAGVLETLVVWEPEAVALAPLDKATTAAAQLAFSAIPVLVVVVLALWATPTVSVETVATVWVRPLTALQLLGLAVVVVALTAIALLELAAMVAAATEADKAPTQQPAAPPTQVAVVAVAQTLAQQATAVPAW
jgi:hypothetical protein